MFSGTTGLMSWPRVVVSMAASGGGDNPRAASCRKPLVGSQLPVGDHIYSLIPDSSHQQIQQTCGELLKRKSMNFHSNSYKCEPFK